MNLKCNHNIWLERPARDKHSSLLRTLNYGRKTFYNIGPGQCYKTIFICNFRNKLECLSLTIFFSLVCCFLARPGAYPRVEQKVLQYGRLLLYQQTLDLALYLIRYKLGCLSLASLSKCVRQRSGAYFRGERMKGTPFKQAPSLTNKH